MIGISANIHYLDARIDGPRIVGARTSPLRIFASGWSEFPALLDKGPPPSAGVYLLTGPAASNPSRLAVRPGEARDLRRRLMEHTQDPTKAGYAEVYAVAAVDDRLDKSDVRYLEARLHELVSAEPGCSLEVDRIPVVAACPPHERDTLESLLAQARVLLHAAGCRALDRQHMPYAPQEPERDEGSVEVRLDFSGSQEDEHELVYDGIWSRGYPTDTGFMIRAGSDIRRRENSALLPAVASRRRLLAEKGVLGTLPGVPDRWRLLANVHCSSALLAAKIATGAHLSNRGIWQRLAPDVRTVLAP